jgi:hypothetical protein
MSQEPMEETLKRLYKEAIRVFGNYGNFKYRSILKENPSQEELQDLIYSWRDWKSVDEIPIPEQPKPIPPPLVTFEPPQTRVPTRRTKTPKEPKLPKEPKPKPPPIPPKELDIDEVITEIMKLRKELDGIILQLPPITDKPSGFKSSYKDNPLLRREHVYTNKNSFPLKKYMKEFSLKHVAPPGTYLTDIIFFKVQSKSVGYLILVNQNTRQAYAEPLNLIIVNDESAKLLKDIKSMEAYVTALKHIIDKNKLKIKFLKGDSEKAFNANTLQRFYQRIGIQFMTSPISFNQTNHTSMSVLDRLVRTIRDMQHQMGIESISPYLMEEILLQYNNSPHKTLSKIFHKSVSPNEMTPEMENIMCDELQEENYNTLTNPNFSMKVGTPVLVYNDPDPMNKRRSVVRDGKYNIIGQKVGLVEIQGNDGKKTLIPRWKIRQ